jgi:hypothetical protein
VGCPCFSHNAQGGWTHGGSGAVGYLFFHFPPAITRVLVSVSVGGMVGVIMGICIENPFVLGRRDG